MNSKKYYMFTGRERNTYLLHIYTYGRERDCELVHSGSPQRSQEPGIQSRFAAKCVAGTWQLEPSLLSACACSQEASMENPGETQSPNMGCEHPTDVLTAVPDACPNAPVESLRSSDFHYVPKVL